MMFSFSRALETFKRRRSHRQPRPFSRAANRSVQPSYERLEDRIALSVYNPVAVPLLTVPDSASKTGVVVATFADSTSPANLSATITWPSGATTVGSTVGTISLVGSVFVPGVGVENEYTVSTNFTAGHSTGANELQYSVSIHDANDSTTGEVFGNIQVTPVGSPAVANGDLFSVAENSSATALHVLTNDTGSGLSVTGITQPLNGSLVISGGGSTVSYQPNHNFTGLDSFTYTITDSNNATSTATVVVGVTSVNQAPTITAPASAVMLVNTNAPITGLAVNDVDAGGGQEKVTLSAGLGTLSLGSTAGLTFSAGTGLANGGMTFTGTISAINNALAGLTYHGGTDTSQADTVTLTVNDQGNSGAGGALSANATINITPNFNTTQLLPDPLKPGAFDLVVNGSNPALGAHSDVISVGLGHGKNSYEVTTNGLPAFFTGVTGRILVFGQDGGSDQITIASAVKAQTLLVGGSGDDTITGGGGVNFISGGPGHNTLNGGAGGHNTLLESGDFNMTLTSGTAKANGSLVGGTIDDVLVKTTFKNAQLTAGNSGDTLDASHFSGNTVLVGGSGADTLDGGSGFNALIGGLGLDTLVGGKNSDLLIGGTTAFDQNAAALSAILTEWSSPTAYATKIAHLLGTKAGGKNGSILLNGATITDDGLANSLTGGAGLDWFFKGVTDDVTDLNAGLPKPQETETNLS